LPFWQARAFAHQQITAGGIFILVLTVALIVWAETSQAASAKEKYYQAERCFKTLRQHPRKQKYRENWLRCIDGFKAVYTHNPSGPWAAAGLFMTGRLNQALYTHSYNPNDRQKALAAYRRVVREFPKSKYRQRSQKAIADLKRKASLKKESQNDTAANKAPSKRQRAFVSQRSLPKKKPTAIAKRKSAFPYAKPMVYVTGLRHWSSPDYTRVVIHADGETTYDHHLLRKDPSMGKPQRLYVDLARSRLGAEMKKTVAINDNLLIDARAGQYTPRTVRVVVDIKTFKTYKVFSLKNPFRIVIDVAGIEKRTALAKKTTKPKSTKLTKIQQGALARQLALGVSRVVIDPGHGGRDFGAPGYLKGVHEKKVVLAIAKKLAKKIRQQLNWEVILTRKGDRYLTLEERTAIANTQRADLFISIHTNSSRNRRAFGVETYYLNLATDDDAIMVAARENATSTKNIGDLQSILNDLMQNTKIDESTRLAGYVQNSMYHHLRKKYSKINNKGVKQAPFYVLIGARMPSILIETSFISNRRECKRLVDPHYQNQLCDGIINGLRRYLRDTSPMTLKRQRHAVQGRG
jgi:N-acetylmuramoyl-L-alanine amidase